MDQLSLQKSCKRKHLALNQTSLSHLQNTTPDLNIGWLLTGNGKMFNSDLNSKNLLVSASEQIDYAAGNISKTELDPVSIPGIEGEGRTFEISDRWLYPILKYGEHLASVRFRVKDYELVDPQKIYAVVTPKKVHITFLPIYSKWFTPPSCQQDAR